MLPPAYYKDACKLFCVWLHRLEERDRRNAAARKRQQEQQAQLPASELAGGASAHVSVSNLPTSLNTRANEERLC
jgi:hypothetical protein